MSQAAVKQHRPAWGWDAERDLIEAFDDGDGMSFDELASHFGRGRNAVEQKISELRKRGEIEPVDPNRIDKRPNQDALHVIGCLGQGGFPALTVHRFPRGVLVTGLPMIWPARL